MQVAEAAELAKFEAARQRALEQKAVQMQQLDDLRVRPSLPVCHAWAVHVPLPCPHPQPSPFS
jgi:hypothetical protein